MGDLMAELTREMKTMFEKQLAVVATTNNGGTPNEEISLNKWSGGRKRKKKATTKTRGED
jgi:hypothetical protein